MSIATFESPQVASQQFFPWVFDDETACDYAACENRQELATESEVAYQPPTPPVQATFIHRSATAARLGKPVRLGAVMIKLLKSYGITDEEIAEGMVAYAATAGLAQAG